MGMQKVCVEIKAVAQQHSGPPTEFQERLLPLRLPLPILPSSSSSSFLHLFKELLKKIKKFDIQNCPRVFCPLVASFYASFFFPPKHGWIACFSFFLKFVF